MQSVLRVCVSVCLCVYIFVSARPGIKEEGKGEKCRSCEMFELIELHHQHIFKSHRGIFFLKS